MKILLIGGSARTRLLLSTLRQLDEQAITLCRDSRSALEEIEAREQSFDYVIWEQSPEDVHQAPLMAAINARQPELPMAYLSIEPEKKPAPPLQLVGAFENSRRGRRVLNCNLAQGGEARSCAPSLDQIIFEYQAPCRKTGT